MSNRLAIILAAGQGTRMKSQLPKVLIEVCGRPMIHYVLDAVFAAGIQRAVVVVGYRADDVRKELASRENVEFVEQREQRGTGHAVMMCTEQIAGHEGPVVVLAGDSPMVQSLSLKALLEVFERDRPACLLGTLHKENPHGLGRIVRDAEGNFAAIVEEKDATEEQRKITEVNMTTWLMDSRDLQETLPQLSDNNQQGEYYLTDCPAIMKAAGKRVAAEPILQPCEALSINTAEQLAVVERAMRDGNQ